MGAKAQKACLKKDDIVEVIAGKEKGKKGKVLLYVPATQRISIEKLNMLKRHTKPSGNNKQGGIIEKEGSINFSNVLLVCDKCGKGVRIKSKKLEDGKRVRVCRKCNEVLDKT
jgi:large subunit ribosomal protein L24